MHAPWPTVGSSDKILVQASQYLMDAAHDFRKRLKAYTATGKGKVQSVHYNSFHMSRVVRKLDFCLCENEGADRLRGNREADQGLCFRYTDSAIPLLAKSEISSL